MRGLLSFTRDERGAAAAELALVLPGLSFLLLGSLYLCMIMYTTTTLHSAAEAAARYASVTAAATGSDPGASNVQTYATKMYNGPSVSTVFAYTPNTADCGTGTTGHTVKGTTTFPLFYGFGTVSVPLTSQACFP